MGFVWVGTAVRSVFYSYSKTNQMHQFSNYLFLHNTLHVSDGLSVHHQEFRPVHTATSICLLLYVQSWTGASGWFYYGNILRCTELWASKGVRCCGKRLEISDFIKPDFSSTQETVGLSRKALRPIYRTQSLLTRGTPDILKCHESALAKPAAKLPGSERMSVLFGTRFTDLCTSTLVGLNNRRVVEAECTGLS
jgi:hypothetical protein